MSWLFEIEDYRQVLKKKIQEEGDARGYRAALARAAGCQPAYLSQVLREDVHFTLEHAAGLSDLWSFSELESEYFLTLVSLGRAGTQILADKLMKKITRLQRQHRESLKAPLSERLYNEEKVPLYYLDWISSAVHVVLSLSDCNTPEAIALRLKTKETATLQALTTLKELGIAEKKGKNWFLTQKTLHASDESLYSALHHRNWREKAQEYFRHGRSGDNFHYTGAFALSHEAKQEIRKKLKVLMADATKIVLPSKEETVSCLNIDWFEV